MDEFQQVVGGGVGAMVFYVVYVTVNIVKDMVSGKPKSGKDLCDEHGAMCVHLETIKSDVTEIKGNVMQIVRDVAQLQGRVE